MPEQDAVPNPEPWEADDAFGIVGKSTVIREVRRRVWSYARLRDTVLITGETGTGKELVARALHSESGRPPELFSAVNCAALPETLLESTLFGHVKGAFTGAAQGQSGLFEAAGKGTLFLDEIGDATPATQRKLLRVLQEREISKVGSTTTIKVQARVVAATLKNLSQLIGTGEFRKDLYARLGLKIDVPPLRERVEDLPLLVQRIIGRRAAELSCATVRFSDEALDKLRGFDWPLNVRDLQNVVHGAMAKCNSSTVGADDIELPEHDGRERERKHLRRRMGATLPELGTALVKWAEAIRKGEQAGTVGNVKECLVRAGEFGLGGKTSVRAHGVPLLQEWAAEPTRRFAGDEATYDFALFRTELLPVLARTCGETFKDIAAELEQTQRVRSVPTATLTQPATGYAAQIRVGRFYLFTLPPCRLRHQFVCDELRDPLKKAGWRVLAPSDGYKSVRGLRVALDRCAAACSDDGAAQEVVILVGCQPPVGAADGVWRDVVRHLKGQGGNSAVVVVQAVDPTHGAIRGSGSAYDVPWQATWGPDCLTGPAEVDMDALFLELPGCCQRTVCHVAQQTGASLDLVCATKLTDARILERSPDGQLQLVQPISGETFTQLHSQGRG